MSEMSDILKYCLDIFSDSRGEYSNDYCNRMATCSLGRDTVFVTSTE